MILKLMKTVQKPRQIEMKEEDNNEGPLYRMDGLTSEADMILTSSSKAFNNFVLPSDKEDGSFSSDKDAFEVKETLVARQVIRKVAAVVKKGKKAQTVKKERKLYYSSN